MKYGKLVLTLLIGVIFIGSLALTAGCKSGTVKAAATSTNVTQDKTSAQKLIDPCIPANQLSLILSKTARQKFTECVGVPKANREAFENALLTAAEHTKHIASVSPAGTDARHTFLNDTVPPLVIKYRNTK